ncbi:MAG: inositol monophosphatase, partial [Deltaproteobacteria bacterium]|nr:inositol monophosphatase [Deltaproteobacteria bacterium]
GYWESRLNPWDLSAGALLVSEAGGMVTSYDGGAFESASGMAVASNGRIQQALLNELAAVQSGT